MATLREEAICSLVDNLGSAKPPSPTNNKDDTETNMLSQLDAKQLSLLSRHIVANDEKFSKHRESAVAMESAVMEEQITGDQLLECSRPEFSRKLPSVKKAVAAKLYKQLKSLSDTEIRDTLRQYSLLSTSSDIQTPRPNDCISIYPSYLPQINLTKKQNKNDIETYNNDEFLVFAYICFMQNEYDKKRTEDLINAIKCVKLNGKTFTETKRSTFCHKVKPHNILGGNAIKCYKLIKQSLDSIEDIVLKFDKDRLNSINNNNEEMKSNDNMDYNGTYCPATQIATFALSDFQTSAHKMLFGINESMKQNNVNGQVLVQYYLKKKDLEKYLELNVRRKAVNILTHMLWNDYMKNENKEHKLFEINKYDRKKLMKYIISLYCKLIKNVIISHKLDSQKCLAIKRKGISKILTTQCGLTLGIATNITDKIYKNIE